MKIEERDRHYLRKILHNARVKAEECYWKTRDLKPINDIWKETLKANKRLSNALEKDNKSDIEREAQLFFEIQDRLKQQEADK